MLYNGSLYPLVPLACRLLQNVDQEPEILNLVPVIWFIFIHRKSLKIMDYKHRLVLIYSTSFITEQFRIGYKYAWLVHVYRYCFLTNEIFILLKIFEG